MIPDHMKHAVMTLGRRPNTVTDEDGTRRVKRALRKGRFSRRVIAEITVDGVEYAFHATKGWRRRRVPL